MGIKGAAGETLRTSINHFDENNDPILGASFVVVVANRPDDTTFPVAFREIGSGMYEASVVTAVTDPPGEWFLLMQADNGYRYEETFDIVGQRATLIPVPAAPQTGATRRQVRLAAAQMLGDLTVVVATVNGTTSTITDEINLQRENNAFNAMQVYCADAQSVANIGQVRTVVSNNPGARTVNVVPPFPAETRVGDVFEFYNYRDQGWRFDEYNRAINDALMRAGEENATLPLTMELPGVYSRTARVMQIPNEFSRFSGVDVYDRDGIPRSVPFGHYTVDRHTREVVFSNKYNHEASGRRIRFRGYREPDLMHSDTDMTHVPTEWLIHEVAAILLQGDVVNGSSQGSRDRVLNMERGGADGRRPTILTTYAPNTVKLARV